MGFLDMNSTTTLELGMRTRQESIPPEKRCSKCEGTGMIRIGCAITHAIYTSCWFCSATGLKEKADELESALAAWKRP